MGREKAKTFKQCARAPDITLMIDKVLGEVLRDNRDNRDGTGWDKEEASTFQRCVRPPGFHTDVTLCAGRGFRVIIGVMETGRDGTGSGENLSSVLKIPGQHNDDWFNAGRSVSG